MSKNKEAVGNLGEEELSFLKLVRQTREDTRRDANSLFTTSHQTRERDQKLLNKLFNQMPAVISTSNMLIKNASAEQIEAFEKVKVAFNVHAFFDGGHQYSPAQRRYPELIKVAKSRPVVTEKKDASRESKTGTSSGGVSLSGAAV